MTLVQLPAELLGQILRDVGSEFFYQDVRRLAISKRWFSFAWPVMTRDLQLTSATLPFFLENHALLGHIGPRLSSVSVHLKSFFKERRAVLQGLVTDRRLLQEQWAAETNSRLDDLAAVLHDCPRIQGLRVTASLETAYLAAAPFVRLLATPNLTSLHLDLAGYYSVEGGTGFDSEPHLCELINALLPTLRHLRCRMYFICEDILGPLKVEDGPLKLEEVIFNLTRADCVGTPGGFPRRCRTIYGDPFSVTDEFETGATELVARMSNPKMVRVISFKPHSYQAYAFDAITGRRSQFNDLEGSWEADGDDMVDSDDEEDPVGSGEETED
ncbi:hypothetical protein NEMBOFW57_005512 [Staphylotrichum longicolle]|uniref:F-box domain-containing protein n=1 Tax=Staphylotrichum longicolle TaxID=669026 RepID=A0AAD4EXM9_9PEZI|nr:hypothetical protein NEMBOFW57_005512 [Staphylotrichum longicolle]